MSRKSLAAEMAGIAKQTKKQLAETIFFMGQQVKLWRAATIIVSHHPEKAERIMLWMAFNASSVADPKTLEAYSEHWIILAQKCGRASGVFVDDSGPKCDGTIDLHPNEEPP